MLETITQYINMMIKSINNMITNNGEGKGGKGGKGNKLMEGLQMVMTLFSKLSIDLSR